jgi:HAD superfamily hydrolase (TIGR01490 family)
MSLPPHLTLFDLDGTLLPIDSDHAFGEFLVRVGWADPTHFKQGNDRFYAQYLAGTLDMPAYVEFATQPWRGRALAEFEAINRQFMNEVVLPMLLPRVKALVQQHQDSGDLVAIVTATNDVVTRPIAQALGVQHLIATDLARDSAGFVTGLIQGVPSFQAGKITRVNDWLAGLGCQLSSFARSTFYSDSPNDLPLLERVSHPVATNPAPALERIAAARGWPILKLFT